MTSLPATAKRPLWRDPVVAAAVTIILLAEVLVVWRALPRALDHDEGEHLRAAAWMASGKTLYRDFAENHTPFLYMVLAPFAPAASNDIAATRHYAMVARALSAIAGIAAVLCMAAFASRLAGDAIAGLPVLAALLTSSWTWLRGVADVRSEPFTLLLFWVGALLVLRAVPGSRRAILAAGAGIGLIAVADLWNPKWPLESLVILGLYARVLWAAGGRRSAGGSPAGPPPARRWSAFASEPLAVQPAGRRRYYFASLAIACVLPLLALCVALRVTTFRDLAFFSFTYAAAVSRWYRGAVAATSAGGFAFCPAWLMPWFAAVGAAIVIWRRRNIVLMLSLVIAAALEVVLLYPYPHLWPQYLVMWACVIALLYGVAVSAVGNRPVARASIAALIVISFVVHEWPRMTQSIGERQWQTMADLQRRLGPGEAAWVRPEELPVAAPAGSYYWYAFDDQVPFSLTYARTAAAKGFLPALGDDDLPPCRILAGTDSMHVRLLDGRAVRNLPASKRCMEELVRRGSLTRIAGTPIWELVR
ncbi:MAG TPA: hypothetical protein VLC46_08660 [Thermoanaerobaculia bacterium]|jgi:hypothetical protein|nr:hypothetical protein [Thermoanaerobaculia bacterium]